MLELQKNESSLLIPHSFCYEVSFLTKKDTFTHPSSDFVSMAKTNVKLAIFHSSSSFTLFFKKRKADKQVNNKQPVFADIP